MKPIFGKAPPLGIRLALAVIASMILILVDGQTSSMTKARSVMETAVGGLYYLANGPRTVLDGVSRLDRGKELDWFAPRPCRGSQMVSQSGGAGGGQYFCLGGFNGLAR